MLAKRFVWSMAVFPPTRRASYEALPLLPYSLVFFSPVVLVLPTDAARRFFKERRFPFLAS